MSFAPVYTKTCKVLILGTYPSPASKDIGFYYGYRYNRFWPMMARLLDAPAPDSIEEKKNLLLMHDIALWDVLESCDIKGASDSSITNPVPNPVWEIVQISQIKRIFLNGSKALQLYKKFCLPKIDLPYCKMPSTSPANARYTMDKLLNEWCKIRKYL